MLNQSSLRSLISAHNVISGILKDNFVSAEIQIEAFENISKGIPILIPADHQLFEFSNRDVFEVDPLRLSKIIYGGGAEGYVGFKSSNQGVRYLSSFAVKRNFAHEFQKIDRINVNAVESIKILRQRFQKVGAFQTRNIPHFGHQKIMERLLDSCDHLVINPVIGPKKTGDVTIECLNAVFGEFFKHKFGGRISFIPFFANMYYAGPREAIHHTILRHNLGFSHFTVGRDHAGADGFFDPNLAPNLVSSLKQDLDIEVFCHFGATHCSECQNVVIAGECDHSSEMMIDISGSEFRKAIKLGEIFPLADKEMQEFVFNNVKNIFEV